MAGLTPHVRVLDTPCPEGLDRGTDPLSPRRELHECRGVGTIQAPGLQLARDRLECIYGPANLLEHASSPTNERTGEAREVPSL
jgi:hypothetical protein